MGDVMNSCTGVGYYTGYGDSLIIHVRYRGGGVKPVLLWSVSWLAKL